MATRQYVDDFGEQERADQLHSLLVFGQERCYPEKEELFVK